MHMYMQSQRINTGQHSHYKGEIPVAKIVISLNRNQQIKATLTSISKIGSIIALQNIKTFQ